MSRDGGIIGRAGIKPTILPIPSRGPVLGILAVTIEGELSNQLSPLAPSWCLMSKVAGLVVREGA